MKNDKLLIFDLDGTLIDTRKDIVRAVNLTLDKLGFPRCGFEEIISRVGYGPGQLILKCIHRQLEPEDQEKAKKTFSRVYQENLIEDSDFFPGMKALLKSLNTFNKAIVTNKSTPHLKKTLHILQGKDYFDLYQGIDENNPPKPDPAVTLKIMRTLKIDPQDTLFIGDSEIDLQTGKNAGVKTCGVLWGYRSRKELARENPDYLVENIARLKELILTSSRPRMGFLASEEV
ncbi:MAG: HAD family hydrolase [Deltaproteobacteria bacterium]|nr:HAD family hydrolase [Deltaproteobacteria bacterium]